MVRSLCLLTIALPAILWAAPPSADEAIVSRLTELERKYALLEARVRGMEDRVNQTKVSNMPASSAAPSTPAQQTPSTVSGAPAPSARIATPNMIAASLVEKKPDDNASNGDTKQLNFMLMFTNNTGRGLSAFSGDLRFRDATGALLFSVELPVELDISTGKQASWLGAIDLNTKDAKQAKLFGADRSALSVEFIPKTITYADGTSEHLK